MMEHIANRQIHLDFHTSGLIGGVASEFDAEAFVRTLQQAHVGGVCVFARCHHGYCYYPTSTGTVHPHLAGRDLLGEMLFALDKAHIQTGIYTTICWDELSASQHPEWLCITDQNKVMKMDPLTGQEMGRFDPGWNFLCWNSPYRNYFRSHLEEVLQKYNAGFLFLDILFNRTPCVCAFCIERMKQNGQDPHNPCDQELNSIESARQFMGWVNQSITKIKPDIGIFYNSRLRVTGEVQRGAVPELSDFGYIGIESLPSGPWGYDHFPIFAKYFQNFGYPCLGYTGKFQKMWGDFGGLKNQAALDYEVIRMMMHGVVACVGDQLHPRGVLDGATYRLIGDTFTKAEVVESALLPSEPIDEIGVMLTNLPKVAKNIGSELDAETGAMKMLMQLQYQFSFIDEGSDLRKYKLIILPDHVVITGKLKSKLDAYRKSGGKLITSYVSLLDADGNVALDSMPVRIDKDLEFTPHYFYPATDEMRSVIEDTDHVQYLRAKQVCVDENAQILCKITAPYFNRTWDHFCSHLQTPPAQRTAIPEMVYDGQGVIYIASELFTCYQHYSSGVLKQMVAHALSVLLDSKLVESDLPSTAEVTLRQNSSGEQVLTILHYVHQRRGQGIDIVEDVLELHNRKLSISMAAKVEKITEIVSGHDLNFRQSNGRVEFTVPVIKGFAVVIMK